MYIVLGILAAAVLGVIIYFFLSSKSSRMLKLAALGALVLSGLVLAVCSFLMVFSGGDSKEADPYAFPLEAVPAPPEKGANVLGLVIFLVVLLLFFGFIIFIGLRDQKKRVFDEAANTRNSDPEI